jgi:hypothetical protein
MYKTNQQAWNEVMNNITISEKRSELSRQMFGQDNLIGLNADQRDQFWTEFAKIN